MRESRLESLDAFRGLTIVAMILVNNPGSWKHVLPPFRHAEWHGWTPTDLVFPFFLFIVGVSLTLSLSRRMEEGAGRGRILFKVLKRTVLLFSLGVFLNLLPSFDFETVRIPGVLQRIALCYLLASLVYLKAGKRARVLMTTALLAGYWLALKLIPVPGQGAGILEEQGNLCAFIDLKLLSGHLYRAGFDPEGLLSTIPAVATVLLGTLAGDWLQAKGRSAHGKAFGLLLAGIPLAAAGLLLHPLFPINKQLWTSTYVLFTGGAAVVFLGMMFFIIDVMKWKGWAYPFFVLGTNAITVFFGSSLMARIMGIMRLRFQDQSLPLKTFIFERLLAPWAGNTIGSLLFPVLLVLLWVWIMSPLYKRKVFIKV